MQRQMPMYNRDHDAYSKQMYDWHLQMAQYQEHLRLFHQDRANQFRGMFKEREQAEVAASGTA